MTKYWLPFLFLVIVAYSSTIRTGILRVGLITGSLPPQGVYVSANGSDLNDGSYSSPLLTLEAAREAVKVSSTNIVWVRGGTYYRTNAFLLDNDDSDTVYKSYPGETVIFTGGVMVTNFVSVTNPTTLARIDSSEDILVADISGLSISDYGDLTNRGSIVDRPDIRSGTMRPWMVELFSSGARQQLSRWPNQDVSGEVWAWTVDPVPGSPKEAITNNWFTYRESNPDDWALTEDVWVHGGWTFMWDFSYEKVVSIEASTNTFHTDRPGDRGFVANAPYEVLNVLEELDAPGEWVLDRSNDLVYWWPDNGAPNSSASLSVLADDFVTITNTSNISIIGFTFQQGRGSGVSLRNSSSNLIAGCVFRELGNMGVVIGNAIYTNTSDAIPVDYDYEGGTANVVTGCKFSELGEGGVAVSGGDRPTLIGCGHVVTNCYFVGFNRNIRNYRPAVKLDGVGITVSHAVIHDSPHQAIWFSGNDHVIEYCNIYDVCKDTDDAGAVYAVTRDWKQQGTIIRYNFIQPTAMHGIYLDDFTSGVTSYGNIIQCVLYPWLVGGGRDNVFANNIVWGYSSVGWHVSNRGATTSTNSIPNLVTLLEQVDYTGAPYSKYGGMTELNSDVETWQSIPTSENIIELGYAQGNSVWTNLFLKANPYWTDIDTNRIAQAQNFYNGTFSGFTGFTTTTSNAFRARQFTLSEGSDPMAAGFEQIPQSLIGVASDNYGVVDPANIAAYPTVFARGQFKPLAIPGTIQAEDYDLGVHGDAYFNSQSDHQWNNAWGTGRYRLQSEFFIWGSLVDGVRYYRINLPSGSWVEYTVTVAGEATYNFTLGYSSDSGDGTYSVFVDGASVATGLTKASPSASFAISSGQKVVRLQCTSGDGRLDYMTFE